MPAKPRPIEDLSEQDTVVDLVVGPRIRSLEGLDVNRVWPIPRRRLIGPFIFLDHMQRAELPPGVGLDVPPHPHIGLATVTWLFDGELMHADSLGIRQVIRPGDLNWMTAGRGITHSERTTDEARAAASRVHGIQAWVALPASNENDEPTFEHVAASRLPAFEHDGAALRLIAGEAFGHQSPVTTASPLFYLEAQLEPRSVFDYPASLGQRGLFVVNGSIRIDGREYAAGRMFVLADNRDCRIETDDGALLMLLGGDKLEGEREVWWNFVSSDPGAIERAKADWAAGRFPAVPGETGSMPLPL